MSLISAYDTNLVTIASGQSLSAGIKLDGLHLFGVILPSAFTGTKITFQMSNDDGASWHDVYDNTESEYYRTFSASRYVAVDVELFSPINALRVRSGTAASPTSEGADRIVQLVLRNV